MTDRIEDGGPAFPSWDMQHVHAVAAAASVRIEDHVERERVYIEARAAAIHGASLRDWFAGKAMARLINGPSAQNICDRDPRYDETNFADVVAINAYEFADAMLRQRVRNA